MRRVRHSPPSNDANAPWAAKLATPFAVLGIRTAQGRITTIEFLPPDTPELAPQDPVAAQAVRQLRAYVDDRKFRFTLPLAPEGTPFRHRVWEALERIPTGEARTYGDIAREVKSAARAVGGACGANPIVIVIPCHRVVAGAGRLGGFMNSRAGDPLAIKTWLLRHEGYGIDP